MEAHHTEARIIPAAKHNINGSQISAGALEVVKALHQAGFEAFLVGGCVRDLLLGLTPKDFDVTTDAEPEEIKEIFHRSRLIGRRFRLAHVRMGREIIEVSTYRSVPSGSDGHLHAMSHSGRLLRDNVYGSREQDVVRRDFTVNAMFYDCERHQVIDYLGGFKDLHDRTLRIIGDAETRYIEDPVRMLRAIRFAAKLGFEIGPETLLPIGRLAHHIQETPAARLFDEILKLFHQGHAAKSFELMREYSLFQHLFVQTNDVLEDENGLYEQILVRALKNTDQRVREGKPVIAAFLFAVVLWGPLRQRISYWSGRGLRRQEAFFKSADEVIRNQSERISLPRRVGYPTTEIWEMQWRLEHKKAKGARQILAHKRFRAAYDFLLLRAEAGEDVVAAADWWTEFQVADRDKQEAMLKAFAPKRARKRRRSGRGKSRSRAVPAQPVSAH